METDQEVVLLQFVTSLGNDLEELTKATRQASMLFATEIESLKDRVRMLEQRLQMNGYGDD